MVATTTTAGRARTRPERPRAARTRSRRAFVWAARVAAVVALAVAGGVLGLRVAGPTARDTALGTVSLRVRPAWEGRVDAFIPIANWGIRVHAFNALLELHLEPRSVDRQALIRAASGDRDVLAEA